MVIEEILGGAYVGMVSCVGKYVRGDLVFWWERKSDWVMGLSEVCIK